MQEYMRITEPDQLDLIKDFIVTTIDVSREKILRQMKHYLTNKSNETYCAIVYENRIDNVKLFVFGMVVEEQEDFCILQLHIDRSLFLSPWKKFVWNVIDKLVRSYGCKRVIMETTKDPSLWKRWFPGFRLYRYMMCLDVRPEDKNYGNLQ